MNALPMLHSRWMPHIDPSHAASLDELVTMRSLDVELGARVDGDGLRRALRRSGDELATLEPAR